MATINGSIKNNGRTFTNYGDATQLSSSDQDWILNKQNEWKSAISSGNTSLANQIHNDVEAFRNSKGYTGGIDGGVYSTNANRNNNGSINPTSNIQTGLNNAGLATNPANAGISHINTSVLGDIAKAQATSGVADARSNYIKNLVNSANSYNQNASDLYNSATNVYKNYYSNVNDLYNDAYKNSVAANQTAAQRGLTSSGLGNALNTSTLVDSQNKVTDLKASRDSDLADIGVQLDKLSADYNTSRDAFLQSLYDAEAKAKADAYTNYGQNYLTAATSNAGYDNDYINNISSILGNYNTNMDSAKLSQDIQTALADKEGEWAYKQQELQGQQELEKLKLMAQLGLTS